MLAVDERRGENICSLPSLDPILKTTRSFIARENSSVFGKKVFEEDDDDEDDSGNEEVADVFNSCWLLVGVSSVWEFRPRLTSTAIWFRPAQLKTDSSSILS